MTLLAVASSTRAAAVRPPRASAASGEAVPAPAAEAAGAGRRPVKVILPKKKPQKWSTGMAPGEYGGGPSTIKPRKYWWGKEDRDPVGNTDDFIWNKNKDFLPYMERVVANGGAAAEPTITRLTPVDEEESGFLSINRAMNLDSVEVDLSKELQAPTRPILQTQVEAARRGRAIGAEAVNGATSPRWRLVPTRREQAKWDRAAKAATGGSRQKCYPSSDARSKEHMEQLKSATQKKEDVYERLSVKIGKLSDLLDEQKRLLDQLEVQMKEKLGDVGKDGVLGEGRIPISRHSQPCYFWLSWRHNKGVWLPRTVAYS